MSKLKQFLENLIFEKEDETGKEEIKVENKKENIMDESFFVPKDPVDEPVKENIEIQDNPAVSFISKATPLPAEQPIAQPVKPSAVSSNAPRSPFINIVENQPQSQFQPQDELSKLINEIQHPKETVKYKPRPVISPIFGVQSNDVAPMRKTEQKEFLNASLKSNVISPISGKETLTIIKEDEIDEKIAVMTTSDFVDNVITEQPVPNVYESVPSFTNTSQQIVQTSLKETETKTEEQNEQISLF